MVLSYFSLGEEHTETSLRNLRSYYGFLGDWAEGIASGLARTEAASGTPPPPSRTWAWTSSSSTPPSPPSTRSTGWPRCSGDAVPPGGAGHHPPLDYPDYRSTALRHPRQPPLVPLPQRLTEVTGPLLGEGRVGEHDRDLTVQHGGEPLGERIIVDGQVLDGDGRPIPDTLVEESGRHSPTRPAATATTATATRPRWTPTSAAPAAASPTARAAGGS